MLAAQALLMAMVLLVIYLLASWVEMSVFATLQKLYFLPG
jgi:hypothetical protein